MIQVAYTVIGILALMPIYWGSYYALQEFLKRTHEEDALVERISSSDAYGFPLIGSGVLFGMYLVVRFFSKDYINALLALYFSIFGTASLKACLDAIMTCGPWTNFLITAPWNIPWSLEMKKEKVSLWTFQWKWKDIILWSIGITVSLAYILTKHWILNNILGEAFAFSGIYLIQLDSFKAGMILLSGLFFYDIFWVFGTEVMVTVAKSFDAPIKVLFPRHLFAKEFHHVMLGLGDIVIPGIFIALCLRFDYHRMSRSISPKSPKQSMKSMGRPVYFHSCLIAYCLGLITTIAVMHVFKAAQPALLYLSPACILSVVILAWFRGELSLLMAFTTDTKEPNVKESVTSPITRSKSKGC